MSKKYILSQVTSIIEKLINISRDIQVITITDNSFCFEHDKKYFFEQLLKELRNIGIPFKQICLDKLFCYKTIEERQSFLLEKKDDKIITVKSITN